MLVSDLFSMTTERELRHVMGQSLVSKTRGLALEYIYVNLYLQIQRKGFFISFFQKWNKEYIKNVIT